MKLTSDQLAKLRRIIEDRHLAFAVRIYGKRVVPDDVYRRLKDAGLLTGVDHDTAKDAYQVGRVLQALNTPAAADMSFDAFQAYLKANPIPLSDVEQRAVGLAASRGAQYIVGLGNKVATQTGQMLIEADAELRNKLKEDIRDQVARGLASRQTVKQIKSDIGHKTGDWTRDLDRIAATEVSMAMNEGLAAKLADDHGDDVEVAVRSRRGCCDQCEAAYKGPDGAPIIFRLKDLQANGTNVGKKRPDQKPVVPPYHPNCLREGSLILTARGPERIEYVTPGTWVYTHEGRLRQVTHTWSTFYEGPLHMVAIGSGFTLGMTPNHALLLGEEWVQAQDLQEGDGLHKVTRVYQEPDQDLDAGKGDVLDVLYGGHGGEALTAVALETGVYVTGAVCHKDRPGVPVRAALNGTLMFCTASGLPAIYPAEDAVLTGSDYVGLDGEPLRFRRGDLRAARAAFAAQDYFRNFQKSKESSRRVPSPPVDGDVSRPTLLPGPITFDCLVTLGTSATSHVQRLDGGPQLTAPQGQCDFAQELPRDFYSKPFRGMVHNLTVAEDNSYIAHGVIVHNCACTLVHVPRGHGFNEDNRMTPLGQKGLRPHAAVKSFADTLNTLSKSALGNHQRFDWFGVPISRVHPAQANGHHHGMLQGPQGPLKCLMGPSNHASLAYVARLPGHDHVILGHHSPEAAAMALSAELGQFIDPKGGAFFSIPLPSLAMQVGGKASAQIEPARLPGLQKARPQMPPRVLTVPNKPLSYRSPKLPAVTAGIAKPSGPKDPKGSGKVALPHLAIRELEAKPRKLRPIVTAPKAHTVMAPALPQPKVRPPVAPTIPSGARSPDAKPAQKPRIKKRQPVTSLPK